MKQLRLSNGSYAELDDEDYARLSDVQWYIGSHGYANAIFRNVSILLHHAVMGSPPPGKEYHHIDGNKFNNQKSNLELLDYSSHLQRHARKQNAFGFRGVFLNGSRFSASISRYGKKHHLGTFDEPEEAARAYDKKAVELYGLDAGVNFGCGH